MIEDINTETIIKNPDLNSLFLSASLQDINDKCKILKSNFYLDSFNYFPITSNYKTFKSLFKRQDNNSIEHFYNKNFLDDLKNNEKNFKKFENRFILGSSPADNYYSNLIHFFPRIFFNNNKEINLVIHRNLSNKFRNLIKAICELRGAKVNFNYLDDEFYIFNNSEIPQFFSIEKSVNILQYFFSKILINFKDLNYGKKIYIRRENATYRKILNEADLIERLKNNGFEIINPNHFEIFEQMKLFSNAELIIAPHGSNLSNIIFCKEGTKIYEIGPKLEKEYEINILNRYSYLSKITKLKYTKIEADSVNVNKHSNIAKKYISKKILDESNYYKNIILKINSIDNFINNL
tara:strand:- start:1110 stop:2159 length:1050 start_codon:yes stop_codon:yes gene_type:complete